MEFLHFDTVLHVACNIDKAHRFFRGSSVGTGHAGNRHTDIGIGCKYTAGRHLLGRLLADRPVFPERGFADIEDFPLGLVGVGDKALAEYFRSARDIDKASGQKASRAGFRSRYGQIILGEQAHYNVLQRLFLIRRINGYAKAFFNLLHNRFQDLLGLVIRFGPGCNPDMHFLCLCIGGDGRVRLVVN